MPWTMDLTSEVGGSGSALTVLGMTDRDVEVMAILTVDNTNPSFGVTFQPMSKRTKRVSIEVSGAPGALLQLRFTQGTTVRTVDIDGDKTVVFNIVD